MIKKLIVVVLIVVSPRRLFFTKGGVLPLGSEMLQNTLVQMRLEWGKREPNSPLGLFGDVDLILDVFFSRAPQDIGHGADEHVFGALSKRFELVLEPTYVLVRVFANEHKQAVKIP